VRGSGILFVLVVAAGAAAAQDCPQPAAPPPPRGAVRVVVALDHPEPALGGEVLELDSGADRAFERRADELRRRAPAIRACFERAVRAQPALEGAVPFVVRRTSVEPGSGPPALVECVRALADGRQTHDEIRGQVLFCRGGSTFCLGRPVFHEGPVTPDQLTAIDAAIRTRLPAMTAIAARELRADASLRGTWHVYIRFLAGRLQQVGTATPMYGPAPPRGVIRLADALDDLCVPGLGGVVSIDLVVAFGR
jgi:hypothetical protein